MYTLEILKINQVELAQQLFYKIKAKQSVFFLLKIGLFKVVVSCGLTFLFSHVFLGHLDAMKMNEWLETIFYTNIHFLKLKNIACQGL